MVIPLTSRSNFLAPRCIHPSSLTLQHLLLPASNRRSCRTVQAVSGQSSSSAPADPIVVVGAGIAGLATALALSKVGLPVRVLEASPDLRKEGAAIGLWDNAWRALDQLGVADRLRSQYLQLDRVELCRDGGEVLKAFAFKDCKVAGQEFRGVRRSALLATLREALPSDVDVTYGAQLVSISEDGSGSPQQDGVKLTLNSGETIQSSMVVGADGARSVVAAHLGLPQARYAGYVAYRGVAHFRGGVPLPTNTIRQIWGQGVRAGLYPLNATDCYWYTCFNADEGAAQPITSAAGRQADALKFVRGWAWDMENCIRNTPPDDISWSRITDRWTRGSCGRGVLTLAGDAAHPMTPNLGQGGCVALEDAVVLARGLSNATSGSGGGWQASTVASALREYEAERAGRCLPLTVRSNIMGQLLQIPLAPVCMVRDTFVRTAFSPSHFLDHTSYDCGDLPTLNAKQLQPTKQR